MRTIDILEAQENLEELIDELAVGEGFAISKGAISLVEVVALSAEEIAALKITAIGPDEYPPEAKGEQLTTEN
jgi:hypothetical protein